MSLRTMWHGARQVAHGKRCVAHDLHMTWPWPLERMCWRVCGAVRRLWKSWIAPLNVIIIIITSSSSPLLLLFLLLLLLYYYYYYYHHHHHHHHHYYYYYLLTLYTKDDGVGVFHVGRANVLDSFFCVRGHHICHCLVYNTARYHIQAVHMHATVKLSVLPQHDSSSDLVSVYSCSFHQLISFTSTVHNQ